MEWKKWLSGNGKSFQLSAFPAEPLSLAHHWISGSVDLTDDLIIAAPLSVVCCIQEFILINILALTRQQYREH